MKRVILYYRCSWADIRRIKERFGITAGVSINGETCTPVDIKDEDWEVLKECERRGYINIRWIIKE